jgi:hypothetical protein
LDGEPVNEPLPLRIHNPNGAQPWNPERAIEFNTFLDVVIGFRVKVEL